MEQRYADALSALRFALWGEKLADPAGMDWQGAVQELRHHTVLGLVSCVVLPPTVPKGIRDELQDDALQRVARFYRYLYAQEQLLSALEGAGVPAVVLKGTAAACAYPHPEGRSMGDIDVLVPEPLYESTYELLRSEGYALRGRYDDRSKHVGLEKEGFEVELHRRFGSDADPGRATAMARHMEEGLAHAQRGACAGSAFPLLPPLQNGLTLLAHMAQHLNAGLGLRQVIDWMMYVHAHLTDEFWEASFQAAARELDLERLAVVATRLCQRHLGLPDDVRWCSCDPQADELADCLLGYVLSVGNFGRKQDRVSGLVQAHLSKAGSGPSSVGALLGQVRDSARDHCPAAREHPALMPFAFTYTAARYAAGALKRRDAVGSLRREAVAARRRRALLDDLGVQDLA